MNNMKKLLTILIGCSLALAATAMAQQEEASPGKKKHQKGEQPPAQEAQPGMNQARPQVNPARPGREARPANEAKPMQDRKAMRKQRTEATAPAEINPHSDMSAPAPAPAAEMKRHGKNANANEMRPGRQMKKERNAPDATNAAEKSANPAPASTNAETAPIVANRPGQKVKGQAKKRDPQVVQQVKTEHANFKAQAKPEKVPAVTFSQGYTISGAAQWQGPQYEVFRSYRPAIHDRGWYSTRYTRIEIIAGGAYYFNNGYWYPAWGYNPSAQYYAYDAPIYVGSRAEPPDRVIADVQSILQQQGYYTGEVDGLLGPLTRDALTQYQTDNGLYATATIDEPTLASLDLG